MAKVDERSRHELHSKLAVVLDPGPAETLMSMLPPVDVATKDDIASLRRDLQHSDRVHTERFEGLQREMDGLRGEVDGKLEVLRGEMGDLRDGLQGQMGDLRDGLRGQMGDLRDGLQGQMGDLRDGLRGQMTSLRGELDAKFEGLRHELGQDLQAIRTDMAEFRADMEARMTSMMRTLFLGLVGAMLSIAGFVLGLG